MNERSKEIKIIWEDKDLSHMTDYSETLKMLHRGTRNLYQIQPNWTTVHQVLLTLRLLPCFRLLQVVFATLYMISRFLNVPGFFPAFCGHKHVCVFVDSVVEFSADNPITEITLFYNPTECFQACLNDC